METPSSTTKRVTRSQTLSALANDNNIPISRKIEDSDKGISQSRRRNAKNQQQDRSALIDITNDSPIVGVAMETPSSAISKQRSIRAKMVETPGSGEALLRGQVKALLQRVEEEAEISKVSMEKNRLSIHLQGFVCSPMGLVAPTPANTPQVDGLIENISDSVTPLPISDEQSKISQVYNISNGKKQDSLESQKSLTRSLFLDFSEKSETSESSECSSLVTTNSSTRAEEEEETTEEKEETEPEDYYDDDYYNDEEESNLVDELCEAILKISVTMPKPAGKHKRYVYDSDGELVGEECEEVEDSSNVLLGLKELQTPEGKHLRFPSEEEEED